MDRATRDHAAELEGRFLGADELLEVRPLGKGHIHDTFVASYAHPDGPRRLVHQRVNEVVFPDPEAIMGNILRVTRHLRAKAAARGGDPDREALTVVPTRDEGPLFRDARGWSWRSYLMVEDATSYQAAPDLALAEATGAAFGRFQADLGDLPGEPLVETIRGFHDTPARLRRLEEARGADPLGRAAGVAEELAFVARRADEAARIQGLLDSGALALRVCHNDTKLDNVLFDAATGRALCVLDLDTVMPGSPLVDFGDAVRYGASTAPEDEADPSQVDLSMPLFAALTRGYLREARDLLSDLEMSLLPAACRVVTLELAVRFLTDHIEGDRYFKVSHPGHNLQRCRSQLALVRAMERRRDQMEAVVREAREELP